MVNRSAHGDYEFRAYFPDAQRVDLHGDFTGWLDRQIPMSRGEDGWWRAACHLPAGDHRFCYLVNGSSWVADYAASGVQSDGSGGWVSLISVPSDVPLRMAA